MLHAQFVPGSLSLIRTKHCPGHSSAVSEGKMRVCVYGSSSSNTSAKFMEASEELGKQLALGGHVCVNGGGKTGCMGGVNEGCKKHGGKIVGVIHEMFL
eukprot:2275425-Rhodomonas_salina.4